MSVLAYIYVCVNCQELHNYTELLIYIYISTELVVAESVRDNLIQSSPRTLWKFFRNV